MKIILKKTPPLGIEPRTCRLTAERSTNWAMEADVRIFKLKSYWTFWVFQNSKPMLLWHVSKMCWHLVREVKEADSKSAGLCPRRFESCRCRVLDESIILEVYLVQWPSGLRRSTQVRVSSEAWVRTPLEPHFLKLSPSHTKQCFCCNFLLCFWSLHNVFEGTVYNYWKIK